VIDVMATCLELAGAAYPKELQGRAVTPMEGKSLVPVLRGEQRQGHEALYWEHFGARAVRQGDWKLVARKGAKWELYDLSKDRTELNDRAAAMPERVTAMEARWEAWAKRSNVYPAPDQQ
jgi:arylsulfatase A-like enzyme